MSSKFNEEITNEKVRKVTSNQQQITNRGNQLIWQNDQQRNYVLIKHQKI